MKLERLFSRIRQILDELSVRRILFVGEDIPEALISSEWSFTLGKADEHGALANEEIFDAAILTGRLASFDPLLLFEQIKRRVRGFIAIFVEPSFIGDARNIEWIGNGFKFGIEAVKDMLETVGFKKVEIKGDANSITCYAWAHEPIKIFNKVPQKARITNVEIKSEKGLFIAELKKPLEIEADIKLIKKQEAFLKIIVENTNKRYVSYSPKFSCSQKVIAKCDSWEIEGRCLVKLELWGRGRNDWEVISYTEQITVEMEEFKSGVKRTPDNWAFIKKLSLEHYEQLNVMACYSSGGALRLVCEFEGKKPESLGLLVRLFDKDGFILNQTAIPNPDIREKEGGFELVCDCLSLPLAKGIYKLGVSAVSYDSSVATFPEDEKEVWFEVKSEEKKSGEAVHSKFALDKLECVEQKVVAKPSIISVHSPTRKGYWFIAEPQSPIWWETTFDWTGNAEFNFRFQLILPMRWIVLLDRNTRDMGLKIDLPSGRWRAIFSLAHLPVQGTVLLGKVDLERDGEVADSRHFWIALPKTDFTQEGIILMSWEKGGEQKNPLSAGDVKIRENSEHIGISVKMDGKSFVELSKISGFEKRVLKASPFDKLASFEFPKKQFVNNEYIVASLKPFLWSQNSICVAGFSMGDVKIIDEPLKIEWEFK